jgi:phenylalanyl-tRNA synthetase beta chain
VRVSLKWLQEYVEIDTAPVKLAEELSMSGTKVEAILTPGKSVDDVVVAEVLEINEHPNADNLTLVDVRTDSSDSQRVVCGARNFSVGDRVPLARVGARLPDMEITERKIRGEVSRGMLCSGAELGVSKDHSGILVLPRDAELGAPVVEVLGLNDTILELEITPNRPDCLGMIGIAREVGALLGKELKIPAADVEPDGAVTSPVRIDVEDPVGCPRFVARYLEGVSIGPSPSWMAARLLSAGVRPISNVVDITNYVLLETGQPLHAYDAAKVHDNHLIVRRARRGETLETLDGESRELDPADLIIADPRKALGIAGVMGGAGSEVSDATTTVILECAYFDPATIAMTSRRHLLWTEASARFERGADPNAPDRAAARATALMAQLAGGRASADVVDVYPAPAAPKIVTLRPRRTTAYLGYDVPAAHQSRYLRSVGLAVEADDAEAAGRLDVSVPTFRPDIVREVDLIEEVARLAGLERLPSTLPPGRAGGLEPAQLFERRLRRTLAGVGMRESWTGSLTSPADLDALRLPADHPARRAVRIANPMSAEESVLRTTLLPSLLRAAARNLAHRVPGVALFELARVYEPTGEQLPQESLVLSGVMTGDRRPSMWRGPAAPWDFFGAKGVVEAALGSLGLGPLSFSPVDGMPWHPTRGAMVTLGDARAGVLGEIHPEICRHWDVLEGTVAFELAFGQLLRAAAGGRERAADLPRYPATFIDLAVVVDESVAAADVEAAIRRAGEPELTSVRLFDLYRGEQIEAGKKSLAYALELRSPDRTLAEDDATRVRGRIVAELEHAVNGRLRT